MCNIKQSEKSAPRVYVNGKFIGIIENNKLRLEFCPSCRMKNYEGSAYLGQCGWCGEKPTNYQIKFSPSKPQHKSSSKLFGPAQKKRRVEAAARKVCNE